MLSAFTEIKITDNPNQGRIKINEQLEYIFDNLGSGGTGSTIVGDSYWTAGTGQFSGTSIITKANKESGGSVTGDYSISIGKRVVVTAETAFATGYHNKAYGRGSFVYGLDNVSQEATSLCGGDYSISQGRGSIAIGYNAISHEWASQAIGYKVQTYGFASCAQGHSTVASGFCSHSQGYYTEASGEASFAGGLGNKKRKGLSNGISSFAFYQQKNETTQFGAQGDYSVVLGGTDNLASKSASVSIGGIRNSTKGNYSIALGGIDNGLKNDYTSSLASQNSIVLGQYASTIATSAVTINSNQCVAIACEGITTQQSNMVYLPAIKLTKTTTPPTPEDGTIYFDGITFWGRTSGKWEALN